MRKISLLCILVLALFCFRAQEIKASDDISAIVDTCRDYMYGWYLGDEERMEKSLHPGLSKRSLRTSPSGVTEMRHTTASDMITYTRHGYGKHLWRKGSDIEVVILDQFQDIANVKVITPHYYEYLQMVRIGGHWLIVHALYGNIHSE